MRVCNATQPRSFVDALQRGAQGDGAAFARPTPTPATPAAPPPVQAAASNGSRASSHASSMRRRVYVQSGRGWDDDRWRAHFLDLFRYVCRRERHCDASLAKTCFEYVFRIHRSCAVHVCAACLQILKPRDREPRSQPIRGHDPSIIRRCIHTRSCRQTGNHQGMTL